jgi:hypothetical protein
MTVMVAEEGASALGAGAAESTAAGSGASSSATRRSSPRGRSGGTPARSTVKTLGNTRQAGTAQRKATTTRNTAVRASQKKAPKTRTQRVVERGRSSGSSYAQKQVGGPQTGTLIAEFMVAVLIIWVQVFTATNKAYVDRISGALWRSTAACAIFFVLALFARGPNTGKVAVTFGALIDIGVLLEATQKKVISTTADILTGQGTGETTAQLTSDTDAPEPHELADTSGTAGAVTAT